MEKRPGVDDIHLRVQLLEVGFWVEDIGSEELRMESILVTEQVIPEIYEPLEEIRAVEILGWDASETLLLVSRLNLIGQCNVGAIPVV